MGDTKEMAAAFEEVLQSGDFGRVNELIQEWAADDFVEEWPQSGERLTKAASMRMNEQYPADVGHESRRSSTSGCSAAATSSSSRARSTTATASRSATSASARSATARSTKMTEYFANPFEAPAWRADFVERMEPTTA